MFYNKSISKVLTELETSKNGLSEETANAGLVKHGANKLQDAKGTPLILKFLAQFKDLMIIILLVASIISITVGAVEGQLGEIIDGSIILGIVILNSILGFVQEYKAEKALDGLKKMTEPEAVVIRGGEMIRVNTAHLTIGDIVVLEAGSIVPADVRLIESASLKCDEASLTGESHAVLKDASIICKEDDTLADRFNMAYAGSTIVNGRGLGVVVAIGSSTEIGKIATALATTKKEETPLQKSLGKIGKILTIVVLVVAAIVFVLEIVARPNESILEAFLTAVAIAVAAIPESLPAVITIIMSMGVARLAKNRAIIKKLHAVETLGSCEIICSDKTGTITQNVMTVKSIYIDGKFEKDQVHNNGMTMDMFIKAIILCNDSKKNKGKFVGDPTETALTNFALNFKIDKVEVEREYVRVSEMPFDSTRKLMSTINEKNGEKRAFVKGAVDMLLDKCSQIMEGGVVRKFTAKDKSAILSANKEMGGKALRVLGVAFCDVSQVNEYKENNLTFLGLVGMIDPPRKEVFVAVKKCKLAGMRPIMITGDHKDTAYAIAKEIGICKSEEDVLTGRELDLMSEEEFLKKLKNVCVFARVSPENKVRIVNGFKKLGKVVAMTGDGVNDAPSMKSASIGVGMGITGTDVTKEVADMIVTDDNFATIVIAVEEGRKIYDNIQKTIRFLFSANMAEILALLLTTIIFPQFIFMLPVQILFVNLITDSLPAIALGLEPAEQNIMKKPPRDNKKTLFANGVGLNIVVMGIVQTLIVLGCYIIGLQTSELVAMSMAFYSLNLVQMFFIFSARSNGFIFKENPLRNKWLNIAVLFGVGILAIIAFTPVHTILSLTSIDYIHWLIVLGLSMSVIVFSELYKLFYRMYLKKKNKPHK